MNINDAIQLALEYFQKGDLQKAEQICREILKIQPNNAQALNLNTAISCLVNSDSAYANYNMGNTFIKNGHLDEGILFYQKALQLNPNFAEAFCNLGTALKEKGQLDQAIMCYQKALQINSNFTEAYFSLGNALKEKEQFDEAITCYVESLRLQPNNAEVWHNLGFILQDKKQINEAIICYQKALQCNPNFISAHHNLSQTLLLSGDFRQGWKEYEWRLEAKNHYEHNLSHPFCNGSDISQLTILLRAEQGFGDMIQFIRYAPLIAKRGAKVIFECPKELTSLLSNVEGICQLVTRGEELPVFDIEYPLLSLPLAFDTTVDSIPSNVPYITVSPLKIRRWEERLGRDHSKLRVGLAWHGNPQLPHKHLSLDQFAILADIKDISFYSLQKGEAAAQAKHPPKGMKLIDYTAEVNDFSDTAAFIENLDLVISIDTAVAHLAGALGKPVWILLPFSPDWRWMLNREDSPWYPTMRLFRQLSWGDWESVISKVKDELLKLLAKN